MNISQRKRHLAKVHSSAVMSLSESHAPDKDEVQATTAPQLAVPVQSAVKGFNVPIMCLEGIRRKATELIGNESAIASAPGQSEEAKMVLSHSGKTPHLVTPSKGGGYACDANCPNWKSIAICSHTVAVAEVNSNLPCISFVRRRLYQM